MTRIVTVVLIFFLVACQGEPEGRIALGSLERERILLTAIQSNLLTDLLVAEGDHAKKGDLLVKLDDTVAQLQADEAKANIDEMQARLTKLENGAREEDVQAARARLLSAQSSYRYQQKRYQRVKVLVESKQDSEASLDSAQSDYDGARAKYQDSHEQLLKLTNGSRPEDIMQAMALVDAAKAKLKMAEKTVSDLNVKATQDGRVEALPWNIGERVSQGAPVVVLLKDGPPFVRAYIPEKIRAQIRIGDTVKVRVDGVPKPFKGRVDKIAMQPSFTPYYGLAPDDRARLVYLAEITLSQDAVELPNGLPAEILR